MLKGEVKISAIFILIITLIIATGAVVTFSEVNAEGLQRTQLTGQASNSHVKTILSVVKISAINRENFTLLLRSGSGSDPMNFNDLTIIVNFPDGTSTYTYSGGATYDSDSFGVEYLTIKNNHEDGALLATEMAEIRLKTARPIVPRENIGISLIPENGLMTKSEFYTPAVFGSNILQLFP